MEELLVVDEDSEEFCRDCRPSADAERRFTEFIPLRSIVTAFSILAALAMGVCPPPRTAAWAFSLARVLMMLETSDALLGVMIH